MEKNLNPDNPGLVRILTTRNRVYAEMVKDALDLEGIPSVIKSPMGSYLRGTFPFKQGFFDFRLYVRDSDSQRGEELVDIIVPEEEL